MFDRRHAEGVSQALPRIVEFAEREGVPIALALTPQALPLAGIDLAGFSLGLHLHPQDEVLAKTLEGNVALTSDCLAGYSAADQSRLISAGARVFEEAIGEPPRLFVAGNWSENADTLRILETAGFRQDGSPLPGFVSACADWGRLPRLAQPYRPSRMDYQARGEANLTYIPVFQGYWKDYLSPENLHYVGARYFMAALKEASVGGAKVVHIYFHSPMATDPYFLTEFVHVLAFARDRIKARFVRPESIAPDASTAPRPFPPAYFAYLDGPMVKSLFVRRFPTFAPEVPGSTQEG